jgi:hypothetical protein
MAFLESDSRLPRFDSINTPASAFASFQPTTNATNDDNLHAPPATPTLRKTTKRLINDAERTRKQLAQFSALIHGNGVSDACSDATITGSNENYHSNNDLDDLDEYNTNRRTEGGSDNMHCKQAPCIGVSAAAASPEQRGPVSVELMRSQFDLLVAEYATNQQQRLEAGIDAASAPDERQRAINQAVEHMATTLAHLGFCASPIASNAAASHPNSLPIVEYAPLLRQLAGILASNPTSPTS